MKAPMPLNLPPQSCTSCMATFDFGSKSVASTMLYLLSSAFPSISSISFPHPVTYTVNMSSVTSNRTDFSGRGTSQLSSYNFPPFLWTKTFTALSCTVIVWLEKGAFLPLYFPAGPTTTAKFRAPSMSVRNRSEKGPVRWRSKACLIGLVLWWGLTSWRALGLGIRNVPCSSGWRVFYRCSLGQSEKSEQGSRVTICSQKVHVRYMAAA